jgi:hypothetical protein
MEINLEIFYDRDDDRKITTLRHVLESLEQQIQEDEVTHLSRLFLKCIFRVLRDDYRNNMDLTRTALKTLLYLFKNGSQILVQENDQSLLGDIIQENPVDQFLQIAKRIFSWEFKRLSKTVIKSERDSPSESEIQSFNLALAKQAQIFSLLVLVIKEYFDLGPSNYLISEEDEEIHQQDNEAHFRAVLLDEHDIVESLVKCLDHSDLPLNQTVTLFLKEQMSKELGKRLAHLHLFLRLAPCLQENKFDHRYKLLIQWLSTEGVLEAFKEMDPELLVTHLMDGLVKGHKESVLVMLNFLSVDPFYRELLVERKLEMFLLSLTLQFLKKSESVVLKKKVLWNLLINMSINKDFSMKLIKTDKLSSLFDKFLSNPSKWICILKFLENLFHFSARDPSFEMPKTLAHYGEDIIQLLEESFRSNESQCYSVISSSMVLLSVFRPSPDEGLLSICRHYLLHSQDSAFSDPEPDSLPNVQIATLIFLNRVCFMNIESFPHSAFDLVISVVMDSLKSEQEQDDETLFQILQFLTNFLLLLTSSPQDNEHFKILRNSFEEEFSLNVVSEFLRLFQTKSLRFLCLAMRFFDLLAVVHGNLSLAEEVTVPKMVREIQLIKVGFYLDVMREREDQLSPKSLESDEDLDYEDYMLNQFY